MPEHDYCLVLNLFSTNSWPIKTKYYFNTTRERPVDGENVVCLFWDKSVEIKRKLLTDLRSIILTRKSPHNVIPQLP